MADISKDERDTHELVLYDRKTLNMSGIVEVISFDDVSVSLKTKCGELYVEGTELHISALDTVKGAVSVKERAPLRRLFQLFLQGGKLSPRPRRRFPFGDAVVGRQGLQNGAPDVRRLF